MSDTPTVLRGGDEPQPEDDSTQPSPEEQEPHDSPESWMVPARQDGVEWADLSSHVATASQAASDDGHLDADIDRHLGYVGTDATTSRARTDFAGQPDAQADMESGKWNPFSQDWRQKYAQSLSNNEAKHPQDYADAVGAGALAEAHAAGGLPDNDPEAVEMRKRRVAASAEALAGQLPHREEFIDASLALTPPDTTEQDRAAVQKRLLDHWAETGQKPSDSVLKAQADPEFRHSLWSDALAHHAIAGFLPGVAGVAGAEAGVLAGAALGAPLGGVGAIPGALIGGLIGSVAAGYAQSKLLEGTEIAKTLAQETKEHPYTSLAGELIGGGALFSPFSEGRTILQNLVGRSANAVISGGTEGTQEYMTEGKLDPYKMAMATGYGSLFPGLNVAGKALTGKIGSEDGRVMVQGIKGLSKEVAGATGAQAGNVANTPLEDAVHYDQLHGIAQRIAADQSGEFRMPDWVRDEDVARLAALRSKEYIVNGDRVENPIMGQHASPHLFDHFSTDHLGEGEAAIARPDKSIHVVNERGQGHFISEAEGTHEFYKGSLAKPMVDGKPIDFNDPRHLAAHELSQAELLYPEGGAREAAIRSLSDRIKIEKDGVGADIDREALKHLQSGADIPRITRDIHSYEVALHVDRKQLYDHDLPIEQQPEFVRQKLGVPEKPELKTGEGADEANATAMAAYREKLKESGWTEAKLKRTGYEHFTAMAKNLKSTLYASQALAKKGIPGITYLDGDSRGYAQQHGIQPHEIDGLSQHNGGYLTHNHVIFHDTPVDMVKRDGTTMLPDHFKEDVEGLARAYHATGALTDGFKAMMVDDSGTFNLAPFRKPAAARADDAKAKRANIWFEHVWNKGLGRNVQAPLQQMKVQIEPFMKDINPLVPEFKAEMDSHGNPMGTDLGNLYKVLEGHTKAAWENMVNGTTQVVLHNDKLQPIVDMIGHQNDAIRDSYDGLAARGLLTPKRWLEDYFVHIVADPHNTQAMGKLTSGGFLGSSASQKARIYPTIEDLLNAGFTLKEANPLKAHLVGISRALHMINKLDMIGKMQDAGWGGTDRHMGDPLNGVGMGDSTFYAHPTIASMWNKMNSSFAFNEGEGSWFRSVLHAANQTKAIKLIWAGVHMMQVNFASVVDGAARTLEATERGQMGLAARALTHTIPGVGAADQWNLGRMTRNAIENDTGKTGPVWTKYGPSIERLIDSNFTALTEGRSVNELVSDNRNLWESAAQNFGGDTIAEKWQNLAKATWAHEKDALGKVWNGKENESPAATLFMMPLRTMGHLGDIFGRVVQTATEGIFGTGRVLGMRPAAIPNIKLGSAVLQAHSYLSGEGRFHTEEQIQRRMTQIRMDVENRYGELNQDTVFLPKLVKQLANLSMVSSGWKWGTWSNAAAAAGYNINVGRRELNPVAMHSMIGTAVAWGIMGTLYQYLHTGTFPWQTDTTMHDLINFRSGKDPKGNVVRGMPFGEPKEYFDLTKVVMSSWSDPMHLPAATAEYMLSATNPLFQAVYAHTLGGGVDPIGHHIANYPGGYMRYMKDNFGPIAHTVFESEKKPELTGLTDWEQVWLGNRPAPSYAADPAKFLKDIEGRNAMWDKRELARARKEASQLAHPEWLEEYIEEKERAMRNGGPAVHTFNLKQPRQRLPGVNRRAF